MTTMQYRALSPEAVRVCMAERDGWVREDRPITHPCQITEEGWKHPTNGGWYGGPASQTLPDYLHDLNAVHKAEKRVRQNEWDNELYAQKLRIVLDRDADGSYHKRTHFASAAQRTEALLTMGEV